MRFKTNTKGWWETWAHPWTCPEFSCLIIAAEPFSVPLIIPVVCWVHYSPFPFSEDSFTSTEKSFFLGLIPCEMFMYQLGSQCLLSTGNEILSLSQPLPKWNLLLKSAAESEDADKTPLCKRDKRKNYSILFGMKYHLH